MTEVGEGGRLDPRIVAEVLAALAYGERRGAQRSQQSVGLAPDGRSKTEQQAVASRERRNWELIEARFRELGDETQTDLFRPYFDAFFEHTEPSDWVEAQTFHYIGDALVSDFTDALVPLLDPVSAEVVRRALGDREDQETFALDELSRAMQEDPAVDRLDRAVERLHGLVAGELDGGSRVDASVETELLAIMGELAVGLIPDAADRAERLADQLAR